MPGYSLAAEKLQCVQMHVRERVLGATPGDMPKSTHAARALTRVMLHASSKIARRSGATSSAPNSGVAAFNEEPACPSAARCHHSSW